MAGHLSLAFTCRSFFAEDANLEGPEGKQADDRGSNHAFCPEHDGIVGAQLTRWFAFGVFVR